MEEQRSTNRRRFLKTTGASVVGVTALSGCSGQSGESGGDSESSGGEATATTAGDDGQSGATTSQNNLANEITVYTWGGAWADKLNEAYFAPFEDEYGVSIDHQKFGDQWQLFSKMKAGTADFHLVNANNALVYPAANQGYFLPLRRKNIPNMDDIIKPFKPKNLPFDPGEAAHSVPLVFGGNGIAYNYEKMDAPQSWDDVFTEQTKGKVSIANFMTQVVGIPAMDMNMNFNELGTDTEAKMKKIWDRVDHYNDYVFQWWGSASTMQQLLTNESALTGVLWSGRTYTLRTENDVPIKYVMPEEGTSGFTDTWSIQKGTPDPERRTAEKLIDFTLEQEPSRTLASKSPYGQPIDIDDPPEAYRNNDDVKYSEKIKLWDPKLLDAHRKEWKRKFQQIARS